MREAKNLKDLLRIRAANRDQLRQLAGGLGSALGFKKRTGQEVSDEPAILVFVPRKVAAHWLPASQRVPAKLTANGVSCPTDVVEGAAAPDDHLKIYDSQGRFLFSDPLSTVRGAAPLSPENVLALEALHGWSEQMVAGAQLGGRDSNGTYTGTAGCFVTDRTTGRLGILTNQHVAGDVGNRLWHPYHAHGTMVGRTNRAYKQVEDEQRFPGVIDSQDDVYVVDCAFVELEQNMSNRIDRRMYGVGTIGAPLALDLETMGPIRRKVVSAGSRRGIQKGTIAAFGYEHAEGSPNEFTDYLIIGEEVRDDRGRLLLRSAFSDPGDSGKLIVTDDDEHRAVALLWGGWHMRLRHGRMQENWTYAIDASYVTKLLDVDIAS